MVLLLSVVLSGGLGDGLNKVTTYQNLRHKFDRQMAATYLIISSYNITIIGLYHHNNTTHYTRKFSKSIIILCVCVDIVNTVLPHNGWICNILLLLHTA